MGPLLRNMKELLTKRQTRLLYLLLMTLFFAGCSLFIGVRLDKEYGRSAPQKRLLNTDRPRTVSYRDEVKPILESRCIVCHGCYDAPCQLDLSAHEGIERGANKTVVYNPGRLLAIEPTRLFIDANSSAEWRKRDFFPVLNERNQTKEANINAGLIAKMLQLKQKHPLPKTNPLPPSFDFSLDRAQHCPTIEEFDFFAKKKPLWGMPYGLPALTDLEHKTLITWLAEGARDEAPPALPPATLSKISAWEMFLNGDALKIQLMSRYLYEHLFLAHLYFDDTGPRSFFRLVRSKTPPGQAIDLIATLRPYDDPKVSRVYYRLQPVRTSILAKNHIPYLLNQKRMSRYRELFLAPDYRVQSLPAYETEASANPFKTFQAIPAKSRYRFLLDEAHFSMMNFIKGPVCNGQVALNVINEHFWVVFLNPNNSLLDHADEFLAKEMDKLRMPTGEASNALLLTNWLKYSKLEQDYSKAKIEAMKAYLPKPEDISLDLIWDGEGQNDNAALTVFRHLNNGTVVKGLVGDNPKTVVVLDYLLLERIHYLLVAGYDIYGNIGHQLNSRLYMDFMRMEGEFNFLTLLPETARVKEWEYWYRDARPQVRNYGALYNQRVNLETGISYKTADPKTELLEMLKHRLSPVLNTVYAIDSSTGRNVKEQLNRLSQIRGLPISRLPPSAIMLIEGAQHAFYTLVHNKGMSNVSELFFEEKRRLPEEDTLTVVRGFLGAYPNAFYRVAEPELKDFVDAVQGLNSEADYQKLLDRFGIRRSDPGFWEHSDKMRQAYHKTAPIQAGLLDYNRLENR